LKFLSVQVKIEILEKNLNFVGHFIKVVRQSAYGAWVIVGQCSYAITGIEELNTWFCRCAERGRKKKASPKKKTAAKKKWTVCSD